MTFNRLVTHKIYIVFLFLFTDAKEEQLADMHAEHRKLLQELEDIERSSQNMKSILDDLHLEEVKTKNTSKITKKALKKAELLFELNNQLTPNDKEVLFKWRLSVYIVKKFLGIHMEQGLGNVLQVVSWVDGSAIECNNVQSPENSENHLEQILWETLSRKSPCYDKWEKLFERN